MAAVTVSRQLGSLGTHIAREAAERLGYRMVWREVINEAARRSGAPEAALAMIDDLGLLGVDLRPEALRAYQQAVREVMDDLTAEGSVIIVGRAGQIILKDRSDVLHVRVIAPLTLRVERTAALQEIPATAAQAQVVRSDRTRRVYLKRCHGVDWNDPQLYDLVLSTQRLTVAVATDLICRAVARVLEGGDAGTPGEGEPGLG
ncbi:MAG: cytidylate kinase-like family protein [Chloroflexota bacterium]|nr:cytidylate kinase-like family protein [Chloroflexota bacterium]